MSLAIDIQATPNPNAWKFILENPVLTEGKATFSTEQEAYGNTLATDLLKINGVKQVHFFGNVITITHRFDSDPVEIHEAVKAVIETRLPTHNPEFGQKDSKIAARENLPEDVKQIEEILDRTIRPGLQGDGGDIEVIKFEENKLFVSYQGACGTCPSSTSGTLMAIEGILRDELGTAIEVIPV
ncbi:MAG: NifU family protein [Proteobacteria bacterium]|jgi:Fe-S cluster biogenesis protein NfuA|nr:NifU family protein [Pseudomonadota bacterium]